MIDLHTNGTADHTTTPTPRTGSARHGPDFRSVNWFGTEYTFTPTQAAIVRQLWQAWENGTPDVGQETLLEGAGAESGRLLDLFRDHPAWGTMISSARRGTFRLNAPADSLPAAPALAEASPPAAPAVDVVGLLVRLLGEPKPLDLSLTLGGWRLTVRLAPEAPLSTSPSLFVPNELQDNIIEALDGKAYHADQLAEAVGVGRRTLFRHPGGLRELQEQGLIKSHRRLGYYRLDALPSEFPDEIE